MVGTSYLNVRKGTFPSTCNFVLRFFSSIAARHVILQARSSCRLPFNSCTADVCTWYLATTSRMQLKTQEEIHARDWTTLPAHFMKTTVHPTSYGRHGAALPTGTHSRATYLYKVTVCNAGTAEQEPHRYTSLQQLLQLLACARNHSLLKSFAHLSASSASSCAMPHDHGNPIKP